MMSDFMEGDWPKCIGLVILWFGHVEAHIDALLVHCGTPEPPEVHADKVLKERCQIARARCLAVAGDIKEVTETFDEADRLISEVRNHIAHSVPVFHLVPGGKGRGSVLAFRRRDTGEVKRMSLDELRRAAEASKALAERLKALRERLIGQN